MDNVLADLVGALRGDDPPCWDHLRLWRKTASSLTATDSGLISLQERRECLDRRTPIHHLAGGLLSACFSLECGQISGHPLLQSRRALFLMQDVSTTLSSNDAFRDVCPFVALQWELCFDENEEWRL